MVIFFIVGGGVVLDCILLKNARIELRLTVDSLRFTVGGDPNKRQRFTVLNASPFSAFKVEDFTKIKLSVIKLKAQVPVLNSRDSTRLPDPGWLPVDSKSPVTIIGATNEREEVLRPSVVFQPTMATSNIAGYIDAVLSSPGTEISLGTHELEEESSVSIRTYPDEPDRHSIRFVNRSNATLEVGMSEEGSEKCRIRGKSIPSGVQTTVTFRGPFQATASNSRFDGIPKFSGNHESVTLQGELSADQPLIEIFGERGKLRMSIGLVDVSPEDVFPKTAIPIRCIELLSLNQDGELESSLVGEGEVSYPDLPKKDKLSFSGSNYVWLGEISGFRIDRLSLDAQRQGIRVHASGRAPHLRVGTPEYFAYAAPTLLDWLWYTKRSIIIGTVLLVMIGLVLAMIEAFEFGK